MNPPRYHILFLASWYPNRIHRTLGNFVQRHAEAVATQHHVQVLYITQDETIADIEITDEVIAQVRTIIVYYRKHKWFGFFSRIRAFMRGIAYLKKQHAFHFQVVHLNVIWPDGWQAIYLKWRYQLPYIVTEHWTGYDTAARPHPGRQVLFLSQSVVRKAAVVCPVTENLGAAMRTLGLSGNYRPVPNVVDTHLFYRRKKSASPVRFIHISSLNEGHKNISGLLRAWKKATDIRTAIHLDIGGDGPLEPLKKHVAEYAIPTDTISLFGEQPWEVIAEKMAISHCLLMFSNYENLPCVIVEALASAIPVIATRVGGIAEHIDETKGILITKNDEDALTAAIIQVADNPLRFQSEMLQQYAKDHFSQYTVARLFSDVYRDVITKGKDWK